MANGEGLSFEAKVWLFPGKGGWHFVSVPGPESEEIRTTWGSPGAWGSLPVIATIGTSEWQTSLFWDSKSEQYLLPLKAPVRNEQGIDEGVTVRLALRPR